MCLLYEVLSIIHHSKPLTIFLCYKKIKYYKHIFKILILYEKHKENREKIQTGCAIKKTRLKSITNFQRLHIFDHVSKSKTIQLCLRFEVFKSATFYHIENETLNIFLPFC